VGDREEGEEGVARGAKEWRERGRGREIMRRRTERCADHGVRQRRDVEGGVEVSC